MNTRTNNSWGKGLLSYLFTMNLANLFWFDSKPLVFWITRTPFGDINWN